MSVLSVCCKSHDSIRKFRKFCWTLSNTGLCPTSSSIVNRQQLNILQCGLLVGVEFNAPLDTQERVRFKMAVLMYKATHGTAPSYLSQLVRVADAWSTFPPLCSDQSSPGAVRETVYRRRPGLPGRRTHHLEQPTGQRDISPVSVNLPSAFKNISVPGLIP